MPSRNYPFCDISDVATYDEILELSRIALSLYHLSKLTRAHVKLIDSIEFRMFELDLTRALARVPSETARQRDSETARQRDSETAR